MKRNTPHPGRPTRPGVASPADLPSGERITSPSERLEVRLAGLLDLLSRLAERMQDDPLPDEVATRLVALARDLEEACREVLPPATGNA